MDKKFNVILRDIAYTSIVVFFQYYNYFFNKNV